MIERIMLLYLDGRKEIHNPMSLFGFENQLLSTFHSKDLKHEFWLTKTKKRYAIYNEVETLGGNK